MKNNIEIKTKVYEFDSISSEGNIIRESTSKKFLTYNGIVCSKDYFELEPIDFEDVFIFSDLSLGVDYKKGLTIPNFRYGLLKLKKDKNGNVIPMQEEIILNPVYDTIINGGKNIVIGVTPYGCTYYDYVKRQQLIPGILKDAYAFDAEYKGFAKCSLSSYEIGYLPKNIKPINDKNIKLLTEKQVKILMDYQENLDAIKEARNIYKELTGESYNYIKK